MVKNWRFFIKKCFEKKNLLFLSKKNATFENCMMLKNKFLGYMVNFILVKLEGGRFYSGLAFW